MVPDVGQGLGGSRHSRVYRGLSAGPGVFLPFGCHHPVNLVFPVLPEGALTRARDIGSRRSPLTFDRPLLAEEGLRRYRCFRVSPGGSDFPRSWSPMTPRWLSSAFGGFRPSSSFLLVYQREAGFLQGLPFRRVSLLRKRVLTAAPSFFRLRTSAGPTGQGTR